MCSWDKGGPLHLHRFIKLTSTCDKHETRLQGQGTKYLMNLIGYWRSEDQVRVGEYERREFEEGQQDCKDACENGSVGGLAASGS